MTSDDQTEQNTTSDESSPAQGRRWTRKRIGLVAVAAIGGLAIIAAIVVASVYSFAKPAGGPVANALKPAASQLPRPTDEPSATPSADPADGDAKGSTAAPAPAKDGEMDARFGGVVAQTAEVKQDVKTPSGLTANVVSVESYTATAKRAGEVSGPAVKVTLRLTNGTGGAFPLSTASVNAYYGSDATPAAPVAGDPAAKPFSGSLAPGAAATAVYVFSVPADQDGSVTLTLSDQAGARLVVFQ
jgi:hypothetical protein